VAIACLEQEQGECRALEKDGDLYFCGLMKKPSKYIDLGRKREWKDIFLANQFKEFLGAGRGCCSSY